MIRIFMSGVQDDLGGFPKIPGDKIRFDLPSVDAAAVFFSGEDEDGLASGVVAGHHIQIGVSDEKSLFGVS